MTDRHNSITKLFSRRSFLVINLGLILLVGWGFIGEFVRSNTIRKEIAELEQQTVKLENSNTELSRTADQYTNSTMLEREARLKLNLQRPGEEMVIIKDADKTLRAIQQANDGLKKINDFKEIDDPSVSNIRKWINYFFRVK